MTSIFDVSRLRLVAITDRLALGDRWRDKIPPALEGGVTALLLREEDLTAADLYPIARELRAITRDHGAALIVSDRIDVALAAEADGVHLGWTSLPVEAARRVIGRRCWIGFSAHNLVEAKGAVGSGAHYVTFSPVFPTPSKKGLVPVVGLDGLKEAASALSVPVVALGGITEENAADCLAVGAAGVAAIRGLLGAPDSRAAARRYSCLLGLSEGGKP